MKNDFELFLLDNSKIDEIFPCEYRNLKIHKERYDDRFIIIYSKSYKENEFVQDAYAVSGYYDTKEKCLYNCSYELSRLLDKDSLINKNEFSKLENELINNIADYIENYEFKNQDDLMKIAKSKWDSIEDYKINYQRDNVKRIFVSLDNPKIVLEKNYSMFKLTNMDEYYHKKILVDYLNDKEKIIEKYARLIIDSNLESLGLDLFFYYDKDNYLKSIIFNENNTFDNLYLNKRIYDSIKNIEANNLNITISYGGKEMTFKFDKSALVRDLINCDNGSSGYGASYSKVSEFIKENDPSKYQRWTVEFDFKNIISITYGRKELYRSELDEKEKQEELDIEK